MVRLMFHGHSCWELEHEAQRILIDPFLTGNALADVGPAGFDRLDAILLTHGHADHIGDAVEIAKRTGATVVSSYEVAQYCTARGATAHGMNIGGGHRFPFGHVKWTVAHHSSTGPEGEALGQPMGVVLSLGRWRVYHAGDTGLFLDMQLIGDAWGPLDVALLPIGDNFTMDVDDAVRATGLLKAGLSVPMHYDTFEMIRADPGEFVRKVEAAGRRARVVRPGESLVLGG